jgi:hypothetical protein
MDSAAAFSPRLLNHSSPPLVCTAFFLRSQQILVGGCHIVPKATVGCRYNHCVDDIQADVALQRYSCPPPRFTANVRKAAKYQDSVRMRKKKPSKPSPEISVSAQSKKKP